VIPYYASPVFIISVTIALLLITALRWYSSSISEKVPWLKIVIIVIVVIILTFNGVMLLIYFSYIT